MNADQRSQSAHHETGPVITAPRAKQGDRRTMTFWVLVVSTIAAVIVGVVLLGMRDSPPAEKAQIPVSEPQRSQ